MTRTLMLMPILALSLLASGAVGRSDEGRAEKFPEYRLVAGWPQLPSKVEVGPVSAVATDSKDRVYVFHRGPKPILVFDRDGKFIRSWGDDHIKTAHGLRIDPEGNVWVTRHPFPGAPFGKPDAR
jgi:hypothetical protein